MSTSSEAPQPFLYVPLELGCQGIKEVRALECLWTGPACQVRTVTSRCCSLWVPWAGRMRVGSLYRSTHTKTSGVPRCLRFPFSLWKGREEGIWLLFLVRASLGIDGCVLLIESVPLGDRSIQVLWRPNSCFEISLCISLRNICKWDFYYNVFISLHLKSTFFNLLSVWCISTAFWLNTLSSLPNL